VSFPQRSALSDIGETWVQTGICVLFYIFGGGNSETVDEF
jgi:hypothetical protein